MDIKMPILNGIEATKQIKSFRNELPIIALSVQAMSEDENLAREAGCDEFMLKPFSINELSLKLENFGFKKVSIIFLIYKTLRIKFIFYYLQLVTLTKI